ncbi:outer membrane protein assembly factor BamB [Aliiglaciecola sp. 2_MG-2023]|uniref:outer membrane protein assembly factor BamB n=1 Tax=Alteromonadaceae TaxID=72275 RepID=UPI001C09CE35|nr:MULTISPECIES: outer membrane protein assembly factor BamB [Aliiglaciecola]MBU2877885.1 outer membrane protein assembly factor BamB [Aliiglaciecola lipolytica]MDO6709248.1 outer membrane protein assembly factor BamB [Aliiglaciecola sp. 2_MG-2023]MDO6750396.1 outer membrane protein assembly factor BamB [Aliiglaciecola sp. 1_MG-2023]
MGLSWIKVVTFISVMTLAGCSTISGWFMDDEEIEIRTLKPIESKFTATQLWSHDLTGGIDKFYSRLRPAVAYDKVFAASRQGIVAAYELESGKQVWKRDFAEYPNENWYSFITNLWSDGITAKISGGLTVIYETVYLGSENGEVFALDANTGETKWVTKVRGEIIASPAVDENVVLVNTGSGTLFALDANTGEQLWMFESDVPALSLRGISAPVAVNGGALVGTATGKLVVNILGSGQTAWEQTISAPSGATELERIVDIDSQPLVVGPNVYVISFDGTLAAVELRSGRIIWKREYNSYRRLGIDGNSLFVTDKNSNIYSIDRRNGVELWSQGGLKKRNLTSPESIGNYLVVGDKYGFLHWLDKTDGTIVSRMDVGGDDEDEGIYVAPVAFGDKIYTQTRDGELIAIAVPVI